MHHVGTITRSARVANREFRAQCSCGTAGNFSTRDVAAGYLQMHFGKQGGVSSSELVDNSDQLEAEAPVPPLPEAEKVAPEPWKRRKK
jgi:hypothetical protein